MLHIPQVHSTNFHDTEFTCINQNPCEFSLDDPIKATEIEMTLGCLGGGVVWGGYGVSNKQLWVSQKNLPSKDRPLTTSIQLFSVEES